MSGSLPPGAGLTTLVRERPVLVRDAGQRRGSHSVLPKVSSKVTITLHLNEPDNISLNVAGHICNGEDAE